ncbi:MAG: hypothetical protein ACPG8V_02950 [Alphaproteobacteria bacterium]
MNKHKQLVKSMNDNSSDALVMFCDSSSRWFLKFLKPKYRHCFVAIKSSSDWIVYEPLLNRTEITIIRDSKAFEVRKCFESMGCTVVACNINRKEIKPLSMLMPFTCVRAVGRVLGANLQYIFTPYQLYKSIK